MLVCFFPVSSLMLEHVLLHMCKYTSRFFTFLCISALSHHKIAEQPEELGPPPARLTREGSLPLLTGPPQFGEPLPRHMTSSLQDAGFSNSQVLPACTPEGLMPSLAPAPESPGHSCPARPAAHKSGAPHATNRPSHTLTVPQASLQSSYMRTDG